MRPAYNELTRLPHFSTIATGNNAPLHLGTTGDAHAFKKITYPGTNNKTEFIYGPTGGRMKIVETVSGSVTSTRQFIGDEERDGSGAVTKQFFSRGQRNGSTNNFYAKDHLGSIRTLSDDSGLVQASFNFDPSGRPARLEGTAESDFGFAGMSLHARSGLNLTPGRPYSPNLGRWISRDPIEEDDGTNLYNYVMSDPVNLRDPSGLQSTTAGGLTGISPTGLTLILFGPEIAAAMGRIGANSEALYESDPSASGNNLRSSKWAYVYQISACPGTRSPYGPVGKSGIYKYGMGEWDPQYTRMNSQVRALGQGFTGTVLMLFRDRISARIYEASLIISHRNTWGVNPVGNRTLF